MYIYVYICYISLNWEPSRSNLEFPVHRTARNKCIHPCSGDTGQPQEQQSGPPVERFWGVCPPHAPIPSPTVEISKLCSKQSCFYFKLRVPSVQRCSSGYYVKALYVYSQVSECQQIPGNGQSPKAQEASWLTPFLVTYPFPYLLAPKIVCRFC